VADNEPINHMNAPNLAICVAPVIVTTMGPASFVGTMESMGRAQALVRDLITQCEWIFEKEEEENKEGEAGEEEEVEMETQVVAEEEVSGAGDAEISPEIQPVLST
jgi:hypothetical protein